MGSTIICIGTDDFHTPPEMAEGLVKSFKKQGFSVALNTCEVLRLSERTLQRWQTGETVHCDQRPLRDYQPPHKLTASERAEVLAVANSDEFGHLPPSQIVPRLADQGRYLASESTFYRILREENQLAHRRSEQPAQVRAKPRAISATAPNQLYSWDITYRAPSPWRCYG